MVRIRALTSSMVLAGAVFFPAATLLAQNSPSAAAHRATLDTYCIGCHGGPTPVAGLHLDTLDTANFETNGVTWEKLARKLRNREMPPAGKPRPDAATYDALVKYIETGRDRLAEVKPNPGRPKLRPPSTVSHPPEALIDMSSSRHCRGSLRVSGSQPIRQASRRRGSQLALQPPGLFL